MNAFDRSAASAAFSTWQEALDAREEAARLKDDADAAQYTARVNLERAESALKDARKALAEATGIATKDGRS